MASSPHRTSRTSATSAPACGDAVAVPLPSALAHPTAFVGRSQRWRRWRVARPRGDVGVAVRHARRRGRYRQDRPACRVRREGRVVGTQPSSTETATRPAYRCSRSGRPRRLRRARPGPHCDRARRACRVASSSASAPSLSGGSRRAARRPTPMTLPSGSSPSRRRQTVGPDRSGATAGRDVRRSPVGRPDDAPSAQSSRACAGGRAGLLSSTSRDPGQHESEALRSAFADSIGARRAG